MSNVPPSAFLRGVLAKLKGTQKIKKLPALLLQEPADLFTLHRCVSWGSWFKRHRRLFQREAALSLTVSKTIRADK
jgi:hypothetical protein